MALPPPARTRAFWLRVAVGLIIVLNLHDAVLTLAVFHSGLAGEANPLMEVPLLSWGAVWFMVTKLALVSLGTYLLWRHRNRRAAIIGIGSLAAVYCFLAVYHVKTVGVLARFIFQTSPLTG